MIAYVKKTAPQPASRESEVNRFEQIRKAATEGHRKSESDRRAHRRPRTTD